MSIVDIKGLDKAAVLVALFNASNPQGAGRLQDPDGSAVLTLEEARQVCEVASRPHGQINVDYLKGHPLKVSIGGDSFDSLLFDRDNGEDVAQRAVTLLRESLGS